MGSPHRGELPEAPVGEAPPGQGARAEVVAGRGSRLQGRCAEARQEARAADQTADADPEAKGAASQGAAEDGAEGCQEAQGEEHQAFRSRAAQRAVDGDEAARHPEGRAEEREAKGESAALGTVTLGTGRSHLCFMRLRYIVYFMWDRLSGCAKDHSR